MTCTSCVYVITCTSHVNVITCTSHVHVKTGVFRYRITRPTRLAQYLICSLFEQNKRQKQQRKAVDISNITDSPFNVSIVIDSTFGFQSLKHFPDDGNIPQRCKTSPRNVQEKLTLYSINNQANDIKSENDLLRRISTLSVVALMEA